MPSPRKLLLALAASLALATAGQAAMAQDVSPVNYVETVDLGLTGTDASNNFTARIPGITTWRQKINIRGGGWIGGAGAVMDVYLRGPLNTLGVVPLLRGPLRNENATDGAFRLDALGNFQGSIKIPFENGTFSGPIPNNPDITRPGLYQIRVITHGVAFPTAFDVAGSAVFNICPETLGFPGWHFERGARDGWLREHSPERTDPEYVSVWSRQPVGLYATVAPSTLDGTRLDGQNQGSHITYKDYPWTHFAHDWNLHLVPDFDYLWTMATANFHGSAKSNDTGRIEWEWELQNNGSPFVGSYGQGSVGVPLFVLPTVGDRIYTVGRWILDNGHPDEGDRSEIHPPRMLATMRKRNSFVPFGGGGGCNTRAAQVDVFVSGHGGGVNQTVYTELERLLDNNGRGGARLSDFGIGTAFNLLGNPLGLVYHDVGPNSIVHGTFQAFLEAFLSVYQYFGGPSVPDISNAAGPSAMATRLDGTGLPGLFGTPWLRDQQEFLPVNDMDYEFDVPLPPRPAGATTPQVQVTTLPMHSTAVKEVITYAGNFAHIRLPYKGADNGIYARTFKFYWDAYSAPPRNHFVVQLTEIRTSRANIPGTSSFIGPQPLYLWADVCGQWRFLTEMNSADLLNPKVSTTADVDRVSFEQLQGGKFDVFLDDNDALRVFIGGYAQRDMDSLFGRQFNLNAYDAGIEVLKAALLGTGDNQDLGGVVFEAPLATSFDIVQGLHIVNAQTASINTVASGTCPAPVLMASFKVTYVPRQPKIVAPSMVDFGQVCSGTNEDRVVRISNVEESPLVVNFLFMQGSGFSLVNPPATPFTIAPGTSRELTVRLASSASVPAVGTLIINSNDPCNPAASVALQAFGLRASPTVRATAATTRTPSLVIGATTTWPVSISNVSLTRTGCTLFAKPSIAGTGFSLVLPSSYYDFRGGPIARPITVAPGATNTDLTVKFTCRFIAPKFVGTLTLATNDLANPTVTLVFGAEGVPVGMRVKVVRPDGTPYPVVDDIMVKNPSKKVNTHLRRTPLTTIDPPESWQRIQYHHMAALPPTDDGSVYELRVQVGSHKKTDRFTVGPEEFKELTVTLP